MYPALLLTISLVLHSHRGLSTTRSKETLYNGHYGGHGYKFQIVTCPNGMIEGESPLSASFFPPG